MRKAVTWPPPATDGCEITWHYGWVEQFPEAEFIEECTARPRRVLIYHKAESPRLAEYSLSIRGRVAELDYGGKFGAANAEERRGWDIGVLRITFSDTTRTLVTKLEWADEGEKKFKELSNHCTWKKNASRAAFSLSKFSSEKVALGTAVLRPGQLRFRNSLRTPYGGRCCITGLGIWEALEAAHIKPYGGPSSNHVQNGLLLRADLHRLFDRNLIGIEPTRCVVILAKAMRRDPEYQHLHGKSLTLPSRRADRPNKAVLLERWKAFQKDE
jgi:HNH endonuclease